MCWECFTKGAALMIAGPLVAVALVAACTTQAPPVTAPSACPQPRQYTQAFESEAATAYNTLPAGSPLRQLVDDYGIERKELRACLGQK